MTTFHIFTGGHGCFASALWIHSLSGMPKNQGTGNHKHAASRCIAVDQWHSGYWSSRLRESLNANLTLSPSCSGTWQHFTLAARSQHSQVLLPDNSNVSLMAGAFAPGRRYKCINVWCLPLFFWHCSYCALCAW